MHGHSGSLSSRVYGHTGSLSSPVYGHTCSLSFPVYGHSGILSSPVYGHTGSLSSPVYGHGRHVCFSYFFFIFSPLPVSITLSNILSWTVCAYQGCLIGLNLKMTDPEQAIE